jgi:hypothetical protein
LHMSKLFCPISINYNINTDIDTDENRFDVINLSMSYPILGL